MKNLPDVFSRHFYAALAGLLISVPIAAQGAQNDVVLLWGEVTEGDAMVSFQSQQAGSAVMTQNQACALAGQFVMANLPAAVATIDSAIGDYVGDDAAIEFQNELWRAMVNSEGCQQKKFEGKFWLIFTSCSMIMGNGTQWMRWTVPPFTEEAAMIALDTSTGEGVEVPLETRLEQLDQSVGTGDLSGYNVTGNKGNKNVVIRIPQATEFAAERVDYRYSGLIDPLMTDQAGGGNIPSQALAFMPKISVSSTGHAWVAPDAPGADVIATFYQNFRDNVAPAAGMGSLMTGMVRYMSDVATRGIPVETVHKTSVGAGTMANNFGMSGNSTSEIKSIMLVPGAASGQCARTVVPEGIEITNVNEMMAQAMSGNGGGPGASATTPQQEADMAAAMQQASEAQAEVARAMQNMTPEQRRMMEQMGMGDMLNMANPAGSAAASAAAAGSSAQLTTDNLTQTAQLHLQALGYKVGNTNGELDTNTMIAISQFQAEKGMKVTGEVSPQLIGVLSAEVDKQ